MNGLTHTFPSRRTPSANTCTQRVLSPRPENKQQPPTPTPLPQIRNPHNKTPAGLLLPPCTLFYFYFFKYFYLFMIVIERERERETERERERDRERGRDRGRGRSRLHAQGARRGIRSRVSRIAPRAKGRRQTDRCATQGSPPRTLESHCLRRALGSRTRCGLPFCGTVGPIHPPLGPK